MGHSWDQSYYTWGRKRTTCHFTYPELSIWISVAESIFLVCGQDLDRELDAELGLAF